MPTIRVASPPDLAADEIVTNGLRAALRPLWGGAPGASFSVYLRDDDEHIVGGLLARIAWSWLLVERLWVGEAHRRHGYGARMLASAERLAAAEHRCVGAMLDTFGDAAVPFYQRCGYEVWGTLDDFPPGGQRHFLRKRLTPAGR